MILSLILRHRAIYDSLALLTGLSDGLDDKMGILQFQRSLVETSVVINPSVISEHNDPTCVEWDKSIFPKLISDFLGKEGEEMERRCRLAGDWRR